MKLAIPKDAFVLLIGASGSGKTTFAAKHFRPTQVLSSDFFRGLISDDEADQSVSGDAFELLYLLAEKRLKLGRLTVIDATNVQSRYRGSLLELARKHKRPAIAVVFHLPLTTCWERNRNRTARKVKRGVIVKQIDDLRTSLVQLENEGFREIYRLNTTDEIDRASVVTT